MYNFNYLVQEAPTIFLINLKMTQEVEYVLTLNKSLFERVKRMLFEKITSRSKNQFEISLGKAKFKNYAVYTYSVGTTAGTKKKYRRVETFDSVYYEVKEKIYSETVNYVEIGESKVPMKLNSSIEYSISQEEVKNSNLKVLLNAERILRLSIPTDLFTIDISIRYIFENSSGTLKESVIKENSAKLLKLDFTDFKASTIVPNCTMIYDVEFELRPFVVEKIIDELDHQHVFLKKIEYQIAELITNNNYWVQDMLAPYIRSPQVVSLSNDIISRSKEEDFVLLLKTDGIRNLLVITIFQNEFRKFLKFYRWNSMNSELIDVIELPDDDKVFVCKGAKENTKTSGGSLECEVEELCAIFDCERVLLSKSNAKRLSDEKNVVIPYDYYYIFDVYYSKFKDSVDVRTLTFENRMAEAEVVFKAINKIAKCDSKKKGTLGTTLFERDSVQGYKLRIISKAYEKKVSFKKLVEDIKEEQDTVKDDLAEIEFDGYILQLKCPYVLIPKSNYSVFDLNKSYSFKVKPQRFNTIDFKLKNANSKTMPKYPNGRPVNKEVIDPIYKLYLVCSGVESSFALREASRSKSIERTTDILFLTPFYNQTSIYDASLDDEIEFPVVEVVGTYSNGSVKTKRTVKKVHPKDIDLNNKIVEMYFDHDKNIWKIHRLRFDKAYPNGYRIGLSNMSIHFDPLRLESYYSSKLTKFSDALVEDFHNCSHTVRDVIYNKLQEQMVIQKFDDFKQINFLDIAGGRGGDAEYIIKLMKTMKPGAILNLFGTDISSTGLVKYVLKTQKLSIQYQREINLNVVAGANGTTEQNEQLYEEIVSRDEFRKFNVINMSFAIHYISDYLHEFAEFCKRLMADDTIVMLTFYDSEAVLENIKKFKVFTDIKINLDKNEAYMPLPTIDASGYREEPCMSRKHIEELKSEFEIGFNIIDFNPFFNQKSKISDNQLYFGCVRTLLFIKNV